MTWTKFWLIQEGAQDTFVWGFIWQESNLLVFNFTFYIQVLIIVKHHRKGLACLLGHYINMLFVIIIIIIIGHPIESLGWSDQWLDSCLCGPAVRMHA